MRCVSVFKIHDDGNWSCTYTGATDSGGGVTNAVNNGFRGIDVVAFAEYSDSTMTEG